MRKMLKEFKEFAMRGNVIDLAVGIVVGAAFGRIVTSIVNDIIMPPIGKVTGNVNFTDLFVSLDPAKTQGIASLAQAKATGAAVIAYGQFINTVIDFVIVALSIFLVVKGINRLHRPAPVTPTTKPCSYCLLDVPLKATRCPHCTSELTA
jgi:large conductance mechanosensitive channel